MEPSAQDEVIRSARDFWSGFDLDGRRAALDSQGLELQEAHRRTMTSRKALQEATRAFKAQGETEQVASLGPLLKQYQKEVDTLTRRARAADSAFLSLYKALYEAPDPSQALDAALALAADKPAVKEASRAELEELEDLREEISTLKNQDVTVRKLEAELEQWRSDMDARVAQQVEQREAEMQSLLQSRMMEVADRERASDDRLASMRTQLEQSKAVADQAERRVFEAERRAEEAIAAARTEQALLAADEESLEATQLALRSENESLRRRLKDVEEAQRYGEDLHAGSRGARQDAASSEMELAQLMNVVAAERNAKEQYRLQVENLQSIMKSEQTRTAEAAAANEARLKELEKEIDARPSTEEFTKMRQELQLLRQVEFNVLPEAEPSADSLNGSGDIPVVAPSPEQLLIRKLRKLEGEMLAHKRRSEAAEGQVSSLSEEVKQLKQLAEERRILIGRLEDDLSAASNSSSHTHGGALHASKAKRSEEAEALEGILAEEDPQAAKPISSPVKDPNQSKKGSALSIVTSQRDRFRQRIASLERELQAHVEKSETFDSKERRLKSDNLALYEKIRYLQHQLNHAKGGQSTGVPGRNDAGADAEAGAGPNAHFSETPNAELRYRNMYEASRDPFATFTMVEKRRKLDELNLSEKILLHMSGIFLKSKQMRVFLFFYMLGLHGLVFFTTYYATHFCSEHGLEEAIDFSFFGGDQHVPAGVDWDQHTEHIENMKQLGT